MPLSPEETQLLIDSAGVQSPVPGVGVGTDALSRSTTGFEQSLLTPAQKLAGLLGAKYSEQDIAKQRAQDLQQPILPTNPEYDNTFLAGASRGLGAAIPDVALSLIPGVGLPSLIAKQGLGTAQDVEEQQRAYDESVAAGETPVGERPDMWKEQLKGAATLAAFMGAGKLAAPLLAPTIARAPSLLRPALGVGLHGATNVAADAAIHSAINQGLPFETPAEFGQAAAGGFAFGVPGGIHQGQNITKLIDKIQPDIAAGKAISAAAFKASGLRVPENYTLEENKTTGDYYRPKTAAELILPNASKTAAELAKSTTSPEAETAAKEAEAGIAQEVIKPEAAGAQPTLPVEPVSSPVFGTRAELNQWIADNRMKANGVQVTTDPRGRMGFSAVVTPDYIVTPPEMKRATATVVPPVAPEVTPVVPPIAPAVEPYTGPGSPEFRRQEAIDAFNPARDPEAAAPIAADLLRQNLLRQQQIAEQRAAIERQQRLENPEVAPEGEVPPTGEVPPVTTEARAQAEVAGETAKAAEAAKQKTAEERIAEIDRRMDEIDQTLGRNPDGTINESTNPELAKEYNAISKERVALFNGDESSLGKTPVTETGDTGVPPSVGEDTQRGAGVSGDEGVSGERGAPAVSEPFGTLPTELATTSLSDNVAPKKKPQSGTKSASVQQLIKAGEPVPSSKGYGHSDKLRKAGYVLDPQSEQWVKPLAKETKPVETKPNEAPIQEPISPTPDNAGTNVQGEQGAGPRPDAGVATGVKPSAAHGQAPRSALSPKEAAELAANKAEQVAIFKKKKQSKADEARIEELQARADELEAKGGLPAKTIGNVDGSEKSSAADLVRTGAANGHDLLSKIAESNSPFADLVRHLAERFKPLLTRLGVDHDNTANAQYDPYGHRILVGERRNGDVDIVHEVVHGITANTVFRAVQRLFPNLGDASGDTYIDALRKTAKASGTERPVKDIINQYLHYLDTLPAEQREAIIGKDGMANRPGEWRKSKHAFQYGAVSVQEFIAEAFTDPQFRRDLNTMKAPGGGTIWSKMFDAVRRLLGADVNQKSLLAAVLDTSEKLGDLNKPGFKGEYGLLRAKKTENENERSPLARPEEEGKDRIPEGFTENRLGTTYQDVPSTNEGRTVRFGGPAGEVRGGGGEAQQGATLRSGDNAGGARVGEAPLPAKHIEEDVPTPAASRASFKDKLTEVLKDNKYGARLLRRLAPGVRDVEDTIVRTIDGKDAQSARAAGMVRDTLVRELPDKKDQAAAYVVLDNGGGRAGDADSTAAENLAFHRLQEQRAFLEENLAKATKGPQAQEIQDKIASIEENMARLQEPAPTVDEVKARIQTEIDKGQAALESEEVPEERKKVIRENLPHYQRAYDNAERLVPAAKLAKRAYDDAYLLRQTVDPTGAYYQDYAGRLYEYNETRGGAQVPPDSLIGGRSGVQRYTKQRSYDTLMDAMIGRKNSEGTWEGETPLSLELPDVVANHVKNSNDFVGNETVKDDLSLVRDPQTNEPILLPKLKPGQEAPANYVKVNGPSGEDTWVYKPFADIFRTVWSPDALANSDIGRVSGTAASILKHGTVLYDIFHPSRLIQIGFFEALADGKFTAAKDRLSDYITQVVKPAMLNGEHGQMGKFLAEFNVDPRDIDRYVEKGIITKDTADYLRSDEYKQHAKQMKEGGLRPQLFVDNLWSQAEPFMRKMMSKVHGEFAVDAQMKLNKATFERLAPAMMSAVFKWRRAEFARQNPELSSVQISRQAAKETNERFGNLGKSGPLKSATANSIAQRIALAPHWVISQLMSEARGVAQMGKAVLDATYGRKMPNGQRQRVLRLGNSAKFLATTMGTVFALNQLVNMATRGHPTWQNPEDDHKFDAWLPGGKTGFFYSPTTLAAEYSHHFHNYHKFESAGSAIAHIATNKLSPMGQAAKIALTQKNYKGEKLSTLGTIGEVAKALTPVPISLGSAAQPLNPWASPSKSGQLTNNLARTMGVQLDRAPDAVAQAYESFKKYRTKERPDTGPSPYRDLKTLVQNEASPEKIKAEVDRLMKDGKKMQDIRQSFMAQFHPSGSVVGDIRALQEEPRLTAVLSNARKQKQAEREYFFRALQTK